MPKFKHYCFAAAALCCAVLVLSAGAISNPLWPGSRYTEADRRDAVSRGLQFVYRVASDPKNFTDWGHDLMWCFYTISATAKDPVIREMAHKMGHERAQQWRRDHPDPPLDDPNDLSDFVFGTDAADRLGVPDPTMRDRVRKAVAHFTAVDFLSFDPAKEPPPSDVPNACPKCAYENDRGATRCVKCNGPITYQSRYEIWLDALITSYTGQIYGVQLGGSYDDVLKWIKVMRPYATQPQVSAKEVEHITYAITHVVYTLNDYGRYRLSPAWLPQEFDYLKANMIAAARRNDPETLGEFMDTLRAFGLDERDPLIRQGVEYQLSHQNPDGSWGDMNAPDAYARYHPTWTALDGLREYAFQGERLRRPEFMKLIRND